MKNQGKKPEQIADSTLTITICAIAILWLIAVYVMTHFSA
jgi:hypothetical protein